MDVRIEREERYVSLLRSLHRRELPLIWDYVFKPILYVTCLLALLILIPLVIPILTIFRTVKSRQKTRIRLQYGQSVYTVSSNDAVYFEDTPANPMVINTFLIMRGRMDLDEFRELQTKRLVEVKDPRTNLPMFPKLTKYRSILQNLYVWVEERNFKISDHVFLHDGVMPADKRDLQNLCGQLCTKSLPDELSPWQFILIGPNEQDPDRYCIFLKIHHSLADGVSLVKILLNNLIDKPPAMGEIKRGQSLGLLARMALFTKGALVAPYLWTKNMVSSTDTHCLHGPKLCGQKVVAWSDRIDLNSIKRMRKAAGCTINDILISSVCGSLRQYLEQHSSKVPKDISAFIPVDLRGTKNADRVEMGNDFTVVLLRMPMNERNPLRMLDRVKTRMDRLKKSPEPIDNSVLLQLLVTRLPCSWSRKLLDMFTNKCTVILTNVPGPQEPLTLSGHAVEDMMFWPPTRSDLGLAISIFSYNGHVRVGVYVDKALLSNPEVLLKAFHENLRHLDEKLKVE